MPFRDRVEAGRLLADQLEHYRSRDDVVVLALPRGGVPVAHEAARILQAPLDVFLVRKLGVPGQEELAMGAVAPGGVRVLNREVVETLDIPAEAIEAATRAEEQELARRERDYRAGRPAQPLRGRTVILVDDGLATGSTMRAAIAALREHHPARIAIAVPVAAPAVCRDFQREVDEVVCLETPEPFYAVGYWYRNFDQVSDAEVRELLSRAPPPRRPEAGRERHV